MPHSAPSASADYAPIVFGVKAPRLLGALPDGRGQLWSADVKAVRPGLFCKVFAGVLFVESDGTAYAVGMEAPDGRSAMLKDDWATLQQGFILFLREQTRVDKDALGVFAPVFEGVDYGCEGAATAAYVAVRDVELRLGVGYETEEGEYELVGIGRSADWVANARMTLPFDKLSSA